MIIHELEILVDGATTTKILAIDETLRDQFQAVGCVDLKYKGRRVAVMRQLFTRAAYRRKGIATILVARCAGLASSANCDTLSLLLRPDNKEGIALYRKLGFALAWQDEDGELIMMKSLRETLPA